MGHLGKSLLLKSSKFNLLIANRCGKEYFMHQLLQHHKVLGSARCTDLQTRSHNKPNAPPAQVTKPSDADSSPAGDHMIHKMTFSPERQTLFAVSCENVWFSAAKRTVYKHRALLWKAQVPACLSREEDLFISA